MSKSSKQSEQELLELGKKLQQFYDMGYVDKKQAILFSFYKGIASGFGALIGGTIVIAIVLWVLSLFDQLPFAGHIVQALHHAINSK